MAYAPFAVSNSAPANTSAPTVSGTAIEGETLTATWGVWSGFPVPTYSYQWERSDADISGATGQTYVLVSDDIGETIKVTVTATNAAGSTSASSVATAAIVARDTTPADFSFTAITDAPATSTYYESETVNITDINAPAPVSVAGLEYRLNGGAWTSVSGFAVNDDTLRVRLLSSASWETEATGTVNVGGVERTFSVTTGVEPDPLPAYTTLYTAGDSQIAEDPFGGWARDLITTHGIATTFSEHARAGSRIIPSGAEYDGDGLYVVGTGQYYNSLSRQVDTILATTIPADAVVILLTGGNDLKFVTDTSQFTRIVAELERNVDRLIAGGLTVIYNRSFAAYTPEVLDEPTWASVEKPGIDLYNGQVATMLSGKVGVTIVDLEALFAAIYADPAGYGFSAYGPPDGAFRDGFHPSEDAQPVISNYVAGEL